MSTEEPIHRYFITEEREVTKAEYVAAERRFGFRNTLGQPDEPATSSWSVGSVQGRIEYNTKPAPTP